MSKVHSERPGRPASHGSLPRVLRRAIGLVRFAREAVGASEASLFVLDAERARLRGVASEWDWTRTSFGAELSDWPNVKPCLDEDVVRVLSREEARGAEQGWFEPRGIVNTVCVPMCDQGRAYGVAFFDFSADVDSFDSEDLPLLHDVGRRCGRAIGRWTGDLTFEPITFAVAPSLPLESQRELSALLVAAMTDVSSAEEALEEAMQSITGGPRAEKVTISVALDTAFGRVRAARAELDRLQELLRGD